MIFSTHIMSEVEALCDRIAVVYQGRICAEGTRAQLQQQVGAGPSTPFETVFLRLIGEDEEADIGQTNCAGRTICSATCLHQYNHPDTLTP